MSKNGLFVRECFENSMLLKEHEKWIYIKSFIHWFIHAFVIILNLQFSPSRSPTSSQLSHSAFGYIILAVGSNPHLPLLPLYVAWTG